MTNDIDFAPLLVLGLVVYTLLNLVKNVRAGNWNAALTVLLGWIIGVCAVWLVGASSWGGTVTVGGTKTLDLLSFPDKLLVGLVVISLGVGLYDAKRAIDRSDSAQSPPLLPPNVPLNPPGTATTVAHAEVTTTTVEPSATVVVVDHPMGTDA